MITLLLWTLSAAPPCDAKGPDACRKACAAKDGAACLALGNLMRADEKAHDEMMKAFDAACTLKVPAGCAKLGTWLLKGANDPATQKHAADLFRGACEANDGLGCSNYAALLQDGVGVKQDDAESTRMFEKACKLNDGFACASAGVSYLNGTGVKVDEARGVKLCEQGCAMGSTSGCVTVAALDRFGRAGRKRDPAKAAAVFANACEKEQEPLACASLSDMYAAGEGVKRDPAKAKKLRELACSLGVTDFCDGAKPGPGPAMGN